MNVRSFPTPPRVEFWLPSPRVFCLEERPGQIKAGCADTPMLVVDPLARSSAIVLRSPHMATPSRDALHRLLYCCFIPAAGGVFRQSGYLVAVCGEPAQLPHFTSADLLRARQALDAGQTITIAAGDETLSGIVREHVAHALGVERDWPDEDDERCS